MALSNTNLSFSSIKTELVPSTLGSTFSFTSSSATVDRINNRINVSTTGLSNGMLATYICNTVSGVIPGLANNTDYYVRTSTYFGSPYFQLLTQVGNNVVDITNTPAVTSTSYLIPAFSSVNLGNTYVRALANTANATGGAVITTNLKGASRTKTYSNSAVTSSAVTYVTNEGVTWDLPYANGTSWQISANTNNYDDTIGAYIWNWGSLDYFLYNTDVFEGARSQYGNMSFTIRVAYNVNYTSESDTYFAVIPFLKSISYNPPTPGYTEYGNQLGGVKYLNEGSVVSTVGSIRTRDLTWTASLYTGVSLADSGGWSINYNGQWDLNKINNTQHAFSLTARHASYTSSTSALNFRVVNASMSGTYLV